MQISASGPRSPCTQESMPTTPLSSLQEIGRYTRAAVPRWALRVRRECALGLLLGQAVRTEGKNCLQHLLRVYIAWPVPPATAPDRPRPFLRAPLWGWRVPHPAVASPRSP